MTATSAAQETANGLARVLPALGVLVTEPLPEVLRDSRSQMILLQIVSQRRASTVSEVATAMGIAVPTASTMVRKMVEKGLLERNADPDDWRSVRLTLTATGEGLMQAMALRRAQTLAALVSGLLPGEVATLREAVAILQRLIDSAR